jgi:hypothetical protein
VTPNGARYQYVVECVRRTLDVYLEDLESQFAADLGVVVSRKLMTKRPYPKEGEQNLPFSLLKVTGDAWYFRLLVSQQSDRSSNRLSMCSVFQADTQKKN